MENFFNVIGDPIYICTIFIDVPYNDNVIDKQILTLYIYKILLQLKTTNEKFIVYYGVYKYKFFNYDSKTILPETEKIYKIILNIVSEDANITNEGLYDCYIATGLYANKIFEYDFKDHEHIYRDMIYRVSSSYVFIGDLLTNMWPLPTLVEPAPPA